MQFKIITDEAFERHFKKIGSTRFSTSTNYDISKVNVSLKYLFIF